MQSREKHPWIYDLLFLLVFALAGYLRLTGVNWGEAQHQHPDENTFASVLYLMQAQKCATPDIPVIACPPEQKRWLNIIDYFNSKKSTLNPYNIGFGSFVYGDLPMVAIRIAADITNQLDPRIFGRQASALADLFAIFFLYLIVSNLYNRRVALLASLFSALAVMQIQQSHFFTIDLFVNMFAMLATYFAVKILDARYDLRYSEEDIREEELETHELAKTDEIALEDFNDGDRISNNELPIIAERPFGTNYVLDIFRSPLFLLSIAFGVAYAMALSSKLNIYPLAILLPGAFAVRYFMVDRKQLNEVDMVNRQSSMVNNYWTFVITCLIAGGMASIISFRVFQPGAGIAVTASTPNRSNASWAQRSSSCPMSAYLASRIRRICG